MEIFLSLGYNHRYSSNNNKCHINNLRSAVHLSKPFNCNHQHKFNQLQINKSKQIEFSYKHKVHSISFEKYFQEVNLFEISFILIEVFICIPFSGSRFFVVQQQHRPRMPVQRQTNQTTHVITPQKMLQAPGIVPSIRFTTPREAKVATSIVRSAATTTITRAVNNQIRIRNVRPTTLNTHPQPIQITATAPTIQRQRFARIPNANQVCYFIFNCFQKVVSDFFFHFTLLFIYAHL